MSQSQFRRCPARACVRGVRRVWWLCLAFAHVQATGLGVNQGEFRLDADLTELRVTLSPEPGGCAPGEHEDVRVGGACTAALPLSTSTSSQLCMCACPAGYSGGCAGRRTGVSTTYGWQLPPSGTTLISHVGNPVWGVCKEIGSTCKPRSEPPPPAGPAVGDEFKITTTALICGPDDAGYTSVTVNDAYKNQLIGHYRAMGVSGRCPERSGFTYWLNQWRDGAQARAQETYEQEGSGANWNGHLADGYAWYWDGHLRRAVDHSATENDEAGAGGVAAADDHCQRSANARYGTGKVSASYILQSGNRCRINAVH